MAIIRRFFTVKRPYAVQNGIVVTGTVKFGWQASSTVWNGTLAVCAVSTDGEQFLR